MDNQKFHPQKVVQQWLDWIATNQNWVVVLKEEMSNCKNDSQNATYPSGHSFHNLTDTFYYCTIDISNCQR